MIRPILLFIFITLLPLSLHARDKTWIGVIVPLTGELSHIGETIQNCLLLAKEDHDANDSVDFLMEDDNYRPQQALSAAQKIFLNDHLKGLISFGGPGSLAVAPLTQRNKVPHIAITISENLTEDKDHVFRFFTPVDPLVQAIRKEMQRRKYKNIAMVTIQNDALLVMKESFEKKLPVPVVLNELILPQDLDHRSLALQIKKHNPSAVLLFAIPPHHAELSKQLRGIGYDGDLVAGPPIENRDELTSSMGSLENAWFSTPDDRGTAGFIKRYETRFGNAPHPHGLMAYDVGKIFIEAIKSGDTIQHLNTQETFSGLFGTYPLSSDRSFQLPVILKKITGDKFVVLE